MYQSEFDYSLKLRRRKDGICEATVTKFKIVDGKLPRPIASFHCEAATPGQVFAHVTDWINNGRGASES